MCKTRFPNDIYSWTFQLVQEISTLSRYKWCAIFYTSKIGFLWDMCIIVYKDFNILTRRGIGRKSRIQARVFTKQVD